MILKAGFVTGTPASPGRFLAHPPHEASVSEPVPVAAIPALTPTFMRDRAGQLN